MGYNTFNGAYRQNTDEGTRLTVSLFHENRAAEGTPTISGTAQVGETLMAGMGDIADADGLSATFLDDYTFEWLRVDADGVSNETPIGADAATYTLVAADVGKKIKVRVNFTDDGGTGETLTSDAYPSSGTITAGTLPALSFAGSNITVNETAGTATLTVELDPASTGTVTVDYATSDSNRAGWRGLYGDLGHADLRRERDLEDDHRPDPERHGLRSFAAIPGHAEQRLGRDADDIPVGICQHYQRRRGADGLDRQRHRGRGRRHADADPGT